MDGRITRLKQLLSKRLGEEFVSNLPDEELEWLVSEGFDTAEALQLATVGALHGVAEARAGALCAAFSGEAVGRGCGWG